MLTATPPFTDEKSVVASYVDIIIGRLRKVGLLPMDFRPESIPPLPDALLSSEWALPNSERPRPNWEKGRLVLPPFLVFGRPIREEDTAHEWRSPSPTPTGYWVCNTLMLNGETSLPRPKELNGSDIGFGEAAYLIAQLPELQYCQTDQPMHRVMRAYYSSGRIVLDAAQRPQKYDRFVTFLKEGLRIGACPSVHYDRHAIHG